MIQTDDVKKGSFITVIFWAGMFLTLLHIVLGTLGCMQITGAKKIKLGTWEIEANNGFEVKGGVQQYDFVDDRRGIGAITPKASRQTE